MCVRAHVTMSGGQMTNFRSHFSLSMLWFLGTELSQVIRLGGRYLYLPSHPTSQHPLFSVSGLFLFISVTQIYTAVHIAYSIPLTEIYSKYQLKCQHEAILYLGKYTGTRFFSFLFFYLSETFSQSFSPSSASNRPFNNLR